MSKPLRILALLPRVPWPLEKGDKLRAYHQLRELAKSHEVHVWALSDQPLAGGSREALEPHFASLTLSRLGRPGILLNLIRAGLLGKPFQAGYFYNSRVHREFLERVSELKPDVLYFQLARTAWYADGVDVPAVLDLQDAFSAGLRRRLESSPWYMKPLIAEEMRRMGKYEHKLCENFRHISIISAEDRDLISHTDKDSIVVVPNGVDTSYFSPFERAKTHHIVFTGNMGYPPNVDAARFLVTEVMPEVWKSIPEAKVLLAGASPHLGVKALASEKVTVSGWMEDIRDAYASSRVFIAPMRLGTGMQNKLLEAMAMGMPCITTPLANRPLGTSQGRELLVGDSAEMLADSIIRLLGDQNLAEDLAGAGRMFVASRYSWQGATTALEDLLAKAAGSRRAGV